MFGKLTGVAAATAVGLSAAANGQGAAEQWRVQDGGNGHWYDRFEYPPRISWPEARLRAEQIGGFLACLETPDENAWVWSNIVNIGPDSPSEFGGWIGLYQDSNSAEPLGGWRWLSGSALGYSTSACFDNAFGFGLESFGCYYRNTTYPPGCWADNNEGGCWTWDCEQAFVVEWSADCNNDGIVDYGQCRDGSMWDGNANNVPDCCEQGVPCTVLDNPVQWRTEDGGNGHWYQGSVLASGGYTRAAALAAARARRGDLVSLGSPAERDFIAARALNHPRMWVRDGGTTYGPWSGAFMDATCNWTWSDGSQFAYAPWAFGEPNSGCGWAGDNYGCFACKSCGDIASLPAQFVDLGAGNALAPGLLIEWSADCNNDGIVDFGQIRDGSTADANANGIPDTCECAGADITANGNVDGADLGALLAFWGPAGTVLPEADLNRDGIVDGADLGLLLANWGPCGG